MLSDPCSLLVGCCHAVGPAGRLRRAGADDGRGGLESIPVHGGSGEAGEAGEAGGETWA